MANSTSFKIGHDPWNKGLKGYRAGIPRWSGKGEDNPFFGKKHSPESIEKMRLAKLGKPGLNKGKTWKVSPDKIDNFGKTTGENHPNWKGGITPADKAERSRFRRTMQKKVFERDNYTCSDCKTHGGYLQVDHIKPWAMYPELRFSMDNCVTLCMSCHYLKTYGRKIPEHIGSWGHGLKGDTTNVEV